MTGARAAQLTIDPEMVRGRHEQGLIDAVRGEVRLGRHDRMLYATDASIYQMEPLGVVIPADLDDLASCVRYCVANNLPVLPRGGGTSLAGQCVNRAVVIDLSRNCTNLLDVAEDNSSCTVEVGLSIDDLNALLAQRGVFFAPDPSTTRQAAIGGCIGNNAAGTRSILYGRTAENLLGVDALLPDADATSVRFERGSAVRDPNARRLSESIIGIVRRHERLIRERFPGTLRRNAGYALDMILAQLDEAQRDGVDPLERVNLAHLLCGSEGTLAVTTTARLKLHPLPAARGLAVFGFDSLKSAVEMVAPLLELRPSAVELLDDMVLETARLNTEYRRYVDLMPSPESGPLRAVLYVEFSSHEGFAEVRERFEQAREVVRARHPDAAGKAYEDTTSMERALKLRRAGEPLLHAIPGERKPLGFVEDNAVPVERLVEFVREFRRIIESRGTRGAFWAHASVGVLHVRPLLSLRRPEDERLMEEIAVETADLVKSLGGVMSGEHGDGRVRGPLLERYFGPELLGAFREVKALFDPDNLLNPGNIVEPQAIPTIHEHTRIKPEGEVIPDQEFDTYFEYAHGEHSGGYLHAVELCNGSGVCRKRFGGTMCPSYMGTLDERHATRGRANALRLAITGQLHDRSGPEWGDSETLETLDLCLSCKACKSECPTNVDVARYKAEYLAQTYKARGGPPLPALAFSHVRLANRLGSIMPGVANTVSSLGPSRWLMRRVLGIDERRSMPPFARSLFRRAKGRRSGMNEGLPADAPRVVLFSDCFTTYNEPRIGEATIRVLNAFGYRVVLEDAGCCGRPAISTGCLELARRQAHRTGERLARLKEEHAPDAIIVCEPSCLSAITDDWQDLRFNDGDGGRRERAGLAAISYLPEHFLDDRWHEHPRRPGIGALPDEVVIHAHCHQKALLGEESGSGLFERLAPGRVRVLDSGCCGMAGSFGFLAGHFDLSMRIGERVLLPEARNLDERRRLVAGGTSCRHQVLDGAGVHAQAPMELLAEVLGPSA